MKVSSFDPMLLELFGKAANSTEEIVIQLPAVSQCQYLQARLNKLRIAMRKENHFLLQQAEMVLVAVDKKNSRVVLKRADRQFLPAIQAALRKLPEISKEVERIEHEVKTDNPPSGRSVLHREPQSEVRDDSERDNVSRPEDESKVNPPARSERTSEELLASEKALAKFLGKDKK